MKALFRLFAEKISSAAGTPWAFIIAVGILGAWGLSGTAFRFSEQWQLVINSFTTIVTFLMVFVIQNTQNRDFQAIQLKLDALLQATKGVHSGFISVQDLSDSDLHHLEAAFQRLGSNDDVKQMVKSIEEPRIT